MDLVYDNMNNCLCKSVTIYTSDINKIYFIMLHYLLV